MRRSDYCGPFTIERGGKRLKAVLTIRPWWDVGYAGRAAQINGVRRFVAARRFSRCCEFGSVKPGIAQALTMLRDRPCLAAAAGIDRSAIYH